MWFIIGSAVLLLIAIVAIRSAGKRQAKAEADRRWNERVHHVTNAIKDALCNPSSIVYQGCQTPHEDIESLVVWNGLKDEDKIKAQAYVDKALKWHAEIFSRACAKQVAHREKVDALRREKVGQLTAREIAELAVEKEAIEKEVREAKNDFWFLHSDAHELKFRVWESHQDYLLLKEEPNHV